MSRKMRIALSSILVVAVFIVGSLTCMYVFGDQVEEVNAVTGEYLVDASGYIAAPQIPAGTTQEEARASRGTEDNPFFVLELVPYEGIGNFGYQIQGCEPVYLDRAAWEGAYLPGEGSMFTISTKVMHYWVEDLPEGYATPAQSTSVMNTELPQYGTMKYVGDGTGNYNQVNQTYVYAAAPEGYTGTLYREDGTGGYVEDNVAGTLYRRTPSASYTAAANGDFVWQPLTAQECYQINDDSAEKDTYLYAYHDVESVGDTVKVKMENRACYVSHNQKVITHKNTFLRESVGLAYTMVDGVRVQLPEEEIAAKIEAYHTVVYTVTPEDLNVNLQLIDRADLIVISSMDTTGAAEGVYDLYKRQDLFGRLDSGSVLNKEGATFITNPLDWSAAVRIYSRVTADTNPTPLVFDSKTFSLVNSDNQKTVNLNITLANGVAKTYAAGNATQNNMYKLILMLYMMPKESFEALFGDPSAYATQTVSPTRSVTVGGVTTQEVIKKKNGDSLTTGLLSIYTGDATSYWSRFSFYPWWMLASEEIYDNSNLYGQVFSQFGIMGNDSSFPQNYNTEQNLLRNNVYVFDTSNLMTTEFHSRKAVGNDAYSHEVYEFFDSINGAEGEPAQVTTAECLYYLLHGADGKTTEVYKILELEPSPKYQSKEYWNALIKTYTTSKEDPVVTQMTMAEFIGQHTELAGEYDLIYIGINMINTSASNTAARQMYGTSFVYAHTGPTIEVTDESRFKAMYGWLGTTNAEKEKQFAFSGNDLTELAREKLAAYEQAGYPVMFGFTFFQNTAATEVSTKIDRNSNVYKLAKTDISAPLYEGAFSGSGYTGMVEKFRTKLANSRAVRMLNMTTPKLYDSSLSDAEKYINGLDSSYRTLKFEFTLKAPAGKSYVVYLYVDTDGDGLFLEGEKIIPSVTKNGGGNVSSLTGGNSYKVSYNVTNRVGSVVWKLELIDAATGKVCDSVSDVSAIKANASEKKTLKILQIISQRDDAKKKFSVYLPEAGEVVSGDEILLKDQNGNLIGDAATRRVAKKFYDKIQNLNEFNIEFVRMDETELKPLVEADPKYLDKTYDMLVLGFGDMYNGVSTSVVMNGVDDFISSGKAVLYTHDASSLIGEDGTTLKNWAVAFSKRYRSVFGMDRYDVLPAGATSMNTAVNDTTRSDRPFEPSSSSAGTEYTNNGRALVQGLANGSIFRATGMNGSNIVSTKVNRINKGAITNYPYTIGETISVADTHPQYYQLDMEDENIVVWYTLAGGSGDSAKFYNASPNDVRNNYYIYNIGNITYSGMGHKNNDSTEVELGDAEVELFVNTFVAAYRAGADPVSAVVVNDDVTGGSGQYYLCAMVDSTDMGKVVGGAAEEIYGEYYLQEPEGTGYKLVTTPMTATAKRVYFYINNTNLVSDASFALAFEVNGVAMDLAVFKKSDTGSMAENFMTLLSNDKKLKAGSISNNVYYVDVPLNFVTTSSGGVDVTVLEKTELTIETTIYYKVGSVEYEESATTNVQILPRGLFDLD